MVISREFCEIFKNTFSQNTSKRLLLVLYTSLVTLSSYLQKAYVMIMAEACNTHTNK